MKNNEGVEFHPISLQDQERMKRSLEHEHFNACEYSFASNFIWRKVYDVEAAEIEGCDIIRYKGSRGSQYTFPFGTGDKRVALERLKDFCRERGEKLCLYPLSDEERLLLSEWHHGEFAVFDARDNFDYIYTVEKLSKLSGRKLQKKRNHIARFKDGDDWRYESMTPGNLDECRAMAREWAGVREDKWSKSLEEEMGVLEEAFDNFEELGFVGGLLYKGERLVAFTIGEKVRDEMMIVHFEKAFPDVQGAYPMINQQFVQHECEGLVYVNREDDTGDLGLRKAKQSYYPDILLKKYAVCESEVATADEADREDIIDLWHACFGDDEAYIDFYLKNRWSAENMLILHRDGKAVSMASLLPAKLFKGDEAVPAFYVYAVATLPEYRNIGLSKKILTFAKEAYGRPLFLQVEKGDKGLKSFYKKQDFFECFNAMEKEEISVGAKDERDARDADEPELCEIAPALYRKIRDRYFARHGYVMWNEAAIEYAIKENRLCGGSVYLVRTAGREDILMVRPEGDELMVLETTLREDILGNVLPQVLEETQTIRACRENHGGMLWIPENIRNFCRPDSGYLNLTLG